MLTIAERTPQQQLPALEPRTEAFLTAVAGLPRLAELGATGARARIARLQTTGSPRPAADTTDLTVAATGAPVSVRIVRPRGVSGPLPVILFLHGGGWVTGNRLTHDRLVRELAVGAGAAVVFPAYSRAPEAVYPRAIREGYAVLAWIAAHGPEHRLDGARIAVAGDSTGATIATTLTLLAKERGGPALRAQVLFCPATDASFTTASYAQFSKGYWLRREAMEWFWDQYIPNAALRDEVTASPLRASAGELSRLPPALIITAEADVLRDEGEAYARALEDAGVAVTATRYRGVIHDFVMLDALRATHAAHAAIAQASGYLAQALGPSTAARYW
jgi:acetyl esterase